MRDDDVTSTLEAQNSSTPRASPFEPIDGARFVSGTILADRYRIVGLLGKGGMGEVYRADDLKLSQPVALKFLPDRYLRDGAALARFHREVRLARQVSHKNVCRVYDIGEIDGRHFLSMEFIKGEELSSLIHRIGHLPADKAIQLARQICAGLSAAHDNGILHRDLKPANVMIDADGNARITDFGLAGFAGDIRDDELTAGTPAYMAPEQLDGKTPSVRSDIYSLGLVLYELFTGKRAYDAATFNELMILRRSDKAPIPPSTIIEGLDPAIENVIDRCLQRNPVNRPSSALQVAVALPGGDPIAAALAAGETPSPEMVAAAPKAGALPPLVALGCLAGVIGCLVFLLVTSRYARVEPNVPLEKPPEVLTERAREIIANLGYGTPPVDHAFGFNLDLSFGQHLQETEYKNWEFVRTGQPLSFYFWYKQAPTYLIGPESVLFSLQDPPLNMGGMTTVGLDPRGRLVRFDYIPRQVEVGNSTGDSLAQPATDWRPLFTAAGIDATNLTPTESKWAPIMFADERAAWEGRHVDHPEIPFRIEAAAFRHRPVHFAVIFPWDQPLGEREQTAPTNERVQITLVYVFATAVLVGAVLIGRRNLKLGHGDKRGATKLALFVFLMSMIGNLIGAHHIPQLREEFDVIFSIMGYSITLAALIWLLYVALEPHVRRKWPKLIISWSRLLAGNFRDPMVGRDLLIGGLLGFLNGSFVIIGSLLPRLFGFPSPANVVSNPIVLNGPRNMLMTFININLVANVLEGFTLLFYLLLLYIILRRQRWAVLALFVSVFCIEASFYSFSVLPIVWIAPTLSALTVVIAVARFGLLAGIAARILYALTVTYPLTADFSVWYATSTLFVILVSLGLAFYGFYISLGSQPVFSERLMRDV